ncbi:MAG: hypothetical protein IMY75_04655 [Chloroflexi bacterium]|nr:hypothetical protein [Chloroflexota bacterium]
MNELVGIPDGQEERHGRLPVGGHGKGGAQGEILAQFTPANAGSYDWPNTVIYVRGNQGFITGVKAKEG